MGIGKGEGELEVKGRMENPWCFQQQTNSNIYDNNFLNALFLPLSSSPQKRKTATLRRWKKPRNPTSYVRTCRTRSILLLHGPVSREQAGVELNYFCASWNFNCARAIARVGAEGECRKKRMQGCLLAHVQPYAMPPETEMHTAILASPSTHILTLTQMAKRKRDIQMRRWIIEDINSHLHREKKNLTFYYCRSGLGSFDEFGGHCFRWSYRFFPSCRHLLLAGYRIACPIHFFIHIVRIYVYILHCTFPGSMFNSQSRARSPLHSSAQSENAHAAAYFLRPLFRSPLLHGLSDPQK